MFPCYKQTLVGIFSHLVSGIVFFTVTLATVHSSLGHALQSTCLLYPATFSWHLVSFTVLQVTLSSSTSSSLLLVPHSVWWTVEQRPGLATLQRVTRNSTTNTAQCGIFN